MISVACGFLNQFYDMLIQELVSFLCKGPAS